VITRFVASSFTIVAAGSVLAACGGGGGVPKDAVATVDGTNISRSELSHWTTIAAKSGGQEAVPDAPNYTKCIATKKAATKAAKGKAQTDAQYKAQCAKDLKNFRTSALQQLVSAQWVMAEADKRNIKVTDAAVNKTFQTQKKQAYPKDSDYQAFLKQSGETQADILQSVKVNMLADSITKQVTKGKDTVSTADVSAYYNKNKSQFAKPEQRALRIVINKDKSKASAAASALKSGDSWTTVAKKYSTDANSKKKGGNVGSIDKASLPAALGGPVFKAKKNAIIGPITTSGYSYVLSVTGITPASQQSLSQATATIKQTLQQQKQQNALTAFSKSYESRWRAETKCASDLLVSVCANGPKPTPTPTPSAVAPPTTADGSTGQ
jgi:foldase protein PrsA